MKWEVSGYFNRHQHYKQVFGLAKAIWLLFSEEILKRLKNKESQAQIARSFGVSRTRICEIAHGRAWITIRG